MAFFFDPKCCLVCVAFDNNLPKNIVQVILNSGVSVKDLILRQTENAIQLFSSLSDEEGEQLKQLLEKISVHEIPKVHNFYYDHSQLDIQRLLPNFQLPFGGLLRGKIYQVFYTENSATRFNHFVKCVCQLNDERNGSEARYTDLENTVEEKLAFITGLPNIPFDDTMGIATFRNVVILNTDRPNDIRRDLAFYRGMKTIIFNRLFDRNYDSDVLPLVEPWLRLLQDVFGGLNNITIIFGVNRSDFSTVSQYWPIHPQINRDVPNEAKRDSIYFYLDEQQPNDAVVGRVLLEQEISLNEV